MRTNSNKNNIETDANTQWLNTINSLTKQISKQDKTINKLLIELKEERENKKNIEQTQEEKLIPFPLLVKEYLKTSKADHTKRTHKSVIYICNNLLKYFGDIKIQNITTKMIMDFRLKRKNKDKVSDATINRYLAWLRRMFNEAKYTYEWIKKSPFDNKKFNEAIFINETENTRETILDYNEKENLLYCKIYRLKKYFYYKPLNWIGLYTGLRLGNVLSLTWEKNIDFEKEMIQILKKTKNKKRLQIKMHPRLVAFLKEWYEFRHSFPNPELVVGKKLYGIRNGIKTVFKSAGINKKITYHNLRHTFATHLAMEGANIKTISEVMGHVTGIMMTEKYIHIPAEHCKNAIYKLK